MAKSKFATPEVNLLPGDELENKPQGKFLKWALTWGKRIVVMTELVVILAFLSRFWLDTTVADLNDEIARKKAVVQASAEFEKTFRAVSNRVEKSVVIEKSLSSLTVYDKARALIPVSILLNQITIDKRDVTFNGSAEERSLSELVSAFKDSPDFTNVSVERIARKGTVTTVDFALRATYGSQK